tara:strand:+ start:673 stop:885 length:213 start_codon:yes stop_codon:yes gene_type:complete
MKIMKINMKKKLIIIAFLTASLASCGEKVKDNTCKEYKDKVDLLQSELTLIGGKLDSMILLHDYGFAFTK